MDKLVIFDLDGVLLNSERLYMEMNLHFFASLGFSVGFEEYQTFIGISATGMWGYLKNKFKLPQTVADLIAAEKELKYQTLQKAQLTPTAGVVALLEHLTRAGVNIAIASSGLKKNIDLILEKLQLTHFFSHIVSGEQVEKGKPEPDIFLKTAQYFNISPQLCTVIEDSANGVRAAKAANMFCIGYYNPNSGNQNLSKADLVIDSFSDPLLYKSLGLA